MSIYLYRSISTCISHVYMHGMTPRAACALRVEDWILVGKFLVSGPSGNQESDHAESDHAELLDREINPS